MNDVEEQKEEPVLHITPIPSFYPTEDLKYLSEQVKDMFIPFSHVVVTAEWLNRFNDPMRLVWLLEYCKIYKRRHDKKQKEENKKWLKRKKR